MKEIQVRFSEQIVRTQTVTSFRFKPQEKLDFISGQFLQVLFDPQNPGNKELNKYLSFSCAPRNEYIEVTKRLSESAFSQRLRNLKAGDDVLIKAPLGTCVFKEQYQKIGFLIGGIGITPVISIIEYVMDKRLDTHVCLLYSNRTDEDIAFKKELDAWNARNKNIRISYTVTECQPKDKTCLFGAINTDLLKEKIRDYKERVFFIFGPPRMVEAMKNLCMQLGCDPGLVKVETFVGY